MNKTFVTTVRKRTWNGGMKMMMNECASINILQIGFFFSISIPFFPFLISLRCWSSKFSNQLFGTSGTLVCRRVIVCGTGLFDRFFLVFLANWTLLFLFVCLWAVESFIFGGLQRRKCDLVVRVCHRFSGQVPGVFLGAKMMCGFHVVLFFGFTVCVWIGACNLVNPCFRLGCLRPGCL